MLLLAPGFRFLTSVLVTFAVFIEHVLYAGYCFRYQRTKGTCGACFLVREKVKKYIVYKWGAPWRIAGTGWSVSLGRVRCSCQGRKTNEILEQWFKGNTGLSYMGETWEQKALLWWLCSANTGQCDRVSEGEE